MAVRIRMTRIGRCNRPYYRIGVYDSRTRRDGMCLERLGTYDPLAGEGGKKVIINRESLQKWITQGALPTEAVQSLLKATDVL
ncbi:MAG: 30S ribosomal protein S16 [Planctomycetes bacterium]|nr:30S ribosomal protein S16 [Planctomycetota bacterium]